MYLAPERRAGDFIEAPCADVTAENVAIPAVRLPRDLRKSRRGLDKMSFGFMVLNNLEY
jgi:hypothetical protein